LELYLYDWSQSWYCKVLKEHAELLGVKSSGIFNRRSRANIWSCNKGFNL
jgi:hypothetical protein